jgi:hypothetical protein
MAAILGGGIALAAAAYVFVADFPRGLIVLACVIGALGAAWYGLLRRGVRRILASALTLLLLAVAAIVIGGGDNGLLLTLVVVAFLAGVAGARVAFRPSRSLPRAEPPSHPVLFVNPWSGDGRAARVGLVGRPRGERSRRSSWRPGTTSRGWCAMTSPWTWASIARRRRRPRRLRRWGRALCRPGRGEREGLRQRSRSESTASRSPWSRRCASGSVRRHFESASLAITRARPRRRKSPVARSACSRSFCAWPLGVDSRSEPPDSQIQRTIMVVM